MPSHVASALSFAAILLLVSPQIAAQPASPPAAQPAAPPAAQPAVVTDLEQLAALGAEVAYVGEYRDNQFLYADRVQQLTQQAQQLSGSRVRVLAEVTRVTFQEVIVDVLDADKMRIALRHAEAPPYGNLLSRYYCSSPSGQRLQILSKPVGLRLGSEISLETAQLLRHGDQLVIDGRIEQVLVWIESMFNPTSYTLVGDWQVVDVVKKEELRRQ